MSSSVGGGRALNVTLPSLASAARAHAAQARRRCRRRCRPRQRRRQTRRWLGCQAGDPSSSLLVLIGVMGLGGAAALRVGEQLAQSGPTEEVVTRTAVMDVVDARLVG